MISSPSLLDIGFLLSMVVVGLARCLLPRRGQALLVLLAGPVLIAIASLDTFLLIAGVAIFILFPITVAMRAVRRHGGGRERTRWLLWGGIVLVLSTWVVIRLSRGGGVTLLGPSAVAHLAATFGFSYFIFRAINYLYMHYLVEMPERTPLMVLGFSLFPSTLTSGPIQRYRDFREQCAGLVPVSRDVLLTSIFRITQGFFYKICLSVWLQEWADSLLLVSEPLAYQSISIMVLLYLVFFFDFAGYSHIAIGFGLLLGFRVPENFKKPFLATSVTEFWRNWHVSLGDWFRDQVFIPFGGMRASRLKAGILAGLIMLICGLWHGFTLMFLAWGAWHGTLLLLEAITGTTPIPRSQRHGGKFWFRALATNAKVMFGSLFFLSSFDAVGHVLGGLLRWW